MWLPIIISLCALIFSVFINVCSVAFMMGKMTANQANIKLMLEMHQEQNDKSFNRLETKQDKHNNLIERMAIVEQSSKSAHHREDEIVKRLDKIEEYIK